MASGYVLRRNVKLRDELDEMPQPIRSELHIRPANFQVREVRIRWRRRGAALRVRAMILSVIRFGIAAAEPTYMIEKGWAAYRKQKELDLY